MARASIESRINDQLGRRRDRWLSGRRSAATQEGWLEVVPVRRDGTGRLVAVGLIEVGTPERPASWNLISATPRPDEEVDDTIARALTEALGPRVLARRLGRTVGDMTFGRSWRRGRAMRAGSDPPNGLGLPIAVEISGPIEVRGPAHKFNWYLVTVLPPQAMIHFEHRPVLADFLDAHGEPGLAGRLRQFA